MAEETIRKAPEQKQESFDTGMGYGEFEDGFNLKTIFGALFVGFIMLPGAIYLGILTGQPIAGAAQWVTIILFVEIAKRSFVRLRRQEVLILYLVASGLLAAGVAMGTAGLTLRGGIFGQLIWEQYFIQSPQAHDFGLTELIPRWRVPGPGSRALEERTLMDPSWGMAIVILITNQILFRFNWIGLGYALFRITSDVEKLEFPMAPVAAGGATALAESSENRETWRWRTFSFGSIIGLIFGTFYVGVPALTGLVMARPIMIFPIPFIDLTARIGTVLPGAMLGYSTDLAFIFSGFVLPFWVVTGTFIGAVLTKIIANPILYRLGLLKHWRPGMTAIPTNVVTGLDVWLSVSIGMALVVLFVGFYKTFAGGVFSRKGKMSLREALRDVPKGRGDMPIFLALGLWAVSTAGYVFFTHKLVPAFPLWLICVFGFLATPLLSYISARMYGITGLGGRRVGVSFPYVREASFILSGYKGADIWFVPIPYFDHGGRTQLFKELDLTRTKFTSYYKAEITLFVIMGFCSFLFWGLIWKMGPIPSSTYPYIQKFWPMFATLKSLWATATVEGGNRWMLEAIKIPFIGIGLGAGLLILGGLTLFGVSSQIFYGLMGGIAIGPGALPHSAIPVFIGALLRRYYFEKRFGVKRWRSYAPVLLAGYSCGMGLVAALAIALALIARSASPLIF